MKHLERQARHRLCAFLLRHGHRYDGGKNTWIQTYWRWLERIKCGHPVQQIVFQEYIDSVRQHLQRVEDREQALRASMSDWALAPVVEGLMALRGCRLITVMTVVAEPGDITRCDSPRQLMKSVGLVPSESSSGPKTRRGGSTKTGNGRVRRVLVEAAWCFRFPARTTAVLQRRAEHALAEVHTIAAWKAQKRLCGRYQALNRRGLVKQKTCTAIARELTGLIWAIACKVMPKANGASV